MQYFLASRSLMQIINILSNNVNIKIFLQFGNKFMSQVWLCFHYLFTPFIIKLLNQVLIFFPGFKGGNIFNFILFPKAACVPKSFTPAFGASTGPTKYCQSFF